MNNIIESLFVYYFVEMVISREGSIFIEPVLEKVKFVKKLEYSDYKNFPMKSTYFMEMLYQNSSRLLVTYLHPYLDTK